MPSIWKPLKLLGGTAGEVCHPVLLLTSHRLTLQCIAGRYGAPGGVGCRHCNAPLLTWLLLVSRAGGRNTIWTAPACSGLHCFAPLPSHAVGCMAFVFPGAIALSTRWPGSGEVRACSRLAVSQPGQKQNWVACVAAGMAVHSWYAPVLPSLWLSQSVCPCHVAAPAGLPAGANGRRPRAVGAGLGAGRRGPAAGGGQHCLAIHLSCCLAQGSTAAQLLESCCVCLLAEQQQLRAGERQPTAGQHVSPAPHRTLP